MKKTILLLLCSGLLFAADVSVDASKPGPPHMRKIFDIFRSANKPHPNRLKDIGSSLTRMFPPLTLANFGGGTLFDVVTGHFPNLNYNFTTIDSDWIEPVLEQGGQINLGYCYMPAALGPHPLGPPSNYEAWEEFNFQWAKHFYEKYGITSFEVWNEPDFSDFFNGSRDDYFKMYHYAVLGIKRAVPNAKVGGPALANRVSWVAPFLDYIIANKLPIHFISYHAQDNGNGFKDSGSKYHTRYESIVADLNARSMDSVEVHLNEFSYEISPSKLGSTYDKVQCAAWFASSFKFMNENMPRLARFNKTITDNGDLLDKWKYNGLVTTDNIPKAKYNLFKMYSKMPYTGLPVTTTGAIQAMAAIGDDQMAVMFWNTSSQSEEVNLNVSNLPFTADTLSVWLIDEAHSSYFDNNQSDELERITHQKVALSSYNEKITLNRYGISLYIFHKGGALSIKDPQKPKIPNNYRLSNYPNPFNPSTTLNFQINKKEQILIELFATDGRKLQTLFNGIKSAGSHKLQISSNGLPSGIYFVRLKGRYDEAMHKIVLIK